MSEITLIFPDQLFQDHPAIKVNRPVYLVEEFLFYKIQSFHKQRLILLKAAMHSYAQLLLKRKKEVIYISACDLHKRGDCFVLLAKKGIKDIHIAEFADYWLNQDLEKAAKEYGWKIHFWASPAFLCAQEDLKTFFANKKHFSMSHFYAQQRKHFNILMEGAKPVGGKYSFDTENRKKIPKGLAIPRVFIVHKKQIIKQITADVNSQFAKNWGSAEPFLYPCTHQDAQKALRLFLKERLAYFGAYQDAMDVNSSTLFHSVLSPLLNIGLLTPEQVIKETLIYSEKNSIAINSLEGFLRQIIGWREFVRASYLLKGIQQRTANLFKHYKKIPRRFWEGSTGILPIDTIVKKVLKTGYCNHIERLMVLGNFLLLTQSAPDEVYQWFMANFVDAYDWVMVPNVYGMSQYADGGMIMTKPYICGSNYILKMSNYPIGAWTGIWDGLFWRFIELHRDFFSQNVRTRVLIQLFHKNKSKFAGKIKYAELWLKDYWEN